MHFESQVWSYSLVWNSRVRAFRTGWHIPTPKKYYEYHSPSPPLPHPPPPPPAHTHTRSPPICFLYRDVPTVRVSFSGSSVSNRVYNFTFPCLKQGRPCKSSPFLPLWSHNFHWFRAPSLECIKTHTYRPFVVFWIRPPWSSLEQRKKLQHFLLDRVAKFTSFVSWTGSGFRWVGQTPLPKFLLSTPPGCCIW